MKRRPGQLVQDPAVHRCSSGAAMWSGRCWQAPAAPGRLRVLHRRGVHHKRTLVQADRCSGPGRPSPYEPAVLTGSPARPTLSRTAPVRRDPSRVSGRAGRRSSVASPDSTRRSESTAATAAATVNTVKASVNPSIEGVLVKAAAATVEATATQSSEAVSWAWLDLNPGTSS
jgi:hypothetical protein